MIVHIVSPLTFFFQKFVVSGDELQYFRSVLLGASSAQGPLALFREQPHRDSRLPVLPAAKRAGFI